MEDKSIFVLQVLEVLKRHSNENNYLTQNEVVDYLKKDFNVDSERKAVGRAYKTIDRIYPDLIERGDNNKGVAIIERTFSKDEVIPMIMALYSFKGFSTNLTNQLVDKLKSGFSLKDKFPNSRAIANSMKIENAEVIYNFSILSEAIAKSKYVSFLYTNNSEKQKKRTVCPHYLFVCQEEFKLIGSFRKEGNFTVFNLDSISDIQILEDKDGFYLQDNPKYKDFNIDQFTNEHLYWFQKDAITAKIKMQSETNKKQIIKWFGKQATFYDGNIVEIKNDIDSLYFWLKDYSEYLEVIEPVELRERLYEYGKALVEKYKP